MSRRRVLATAVALAAGSTTLTSTAGGKPAHAAPPQVALPDRGIYDTTAATAQDLAPGHIVVSAAVIVGYTVARD